MKFTEKEKYIKNARKSVGRKYKYRQSDYTNWKIKDGYFFCLKSFALQKATTEPRFLGQEGLEEKITQSTREDVHLQRSLQIRECVAKGVPDMDYEFLPTKPIDNILMEWFKAVEYVLQVRGEYLSLNPRIVKNVAGGAYRQYLLDNL